jgi:hypothetical protein
LIGRKHRNQSIIFIPTTDFIGFVPGSQSPSWEATDRRMNNMIAIETANFQIPNFRF